MSESNSLIIQGIPIDQFFERQRDVLRELVREELNAKNERELQEKFLSPEETCKLFKPAISKPTLEAYAQKDLLKKHYLGGRTWFKYGEVVEAMKQIKKYSR